MFRGSASVITFALLMSALNQLHWLKNMVCIVMLIFSPHASHKLQLLDRGENESLYKTLLRISTNLIHSLLLL